MAPYHDKSINVAFTGNRAPAWSNILTKADGI